jgi:tRNA (cmo5U34)-methyltransferase
MTREAVRTHFEEEAATYIDHIVNFIPHYREQNSLMMDLLPFPREAAIRVLDMGAGPGVLSGLLLEKYPKAEAHLMDLAENMLVSARNNLAQFGSRATFQQGDFSLDDFGSGYDLILSGLAIHHLDHPVKRALFDRLYASLRSGGLLLIRDIVCGETETQTALYERLWCDYIRSMSADERAVMNRYHAEDIPAPLDAQLAWLRETGFVDVGCHWKYLNFAVFGGTKLSAIPAPTDFSAEDSQTSRPIDPAGSGKNLFQGRSNDTKNAV